MHHHPPGRETPQRWQALAFHVKTRLFQLRRGFAEIGRRPPAYSRARALVDSPVVAEKRAPLWRELSPQEFPLTAGKVENLRIAARAFHGLEIPPGGVMSFWRQLGRTTRRKGYLSGRELREGCIVPAIGGGLCQLSGLLYQAALDAGLEIIERHGHSRVVPGSQAEQDLDATVFWNYVDLRFRSHLPWRIETELTATELVVRILAMSGSPQQEAPAPLPFSAPRALPSGDCQTCGLTGCFRHPSALRENAPALGHSAFLLDDLASAAALVLPAWIEHQPRLALLALAGGVPVIATEACGLPPHELLHVLAAPDAAALATVIRSVLRPSPSVCVA